LAAIGHSDRPSPPGSIQANLIVDIKQKTARRKSLPAARYTYSTPRLTVFGPVAVLMQAGSGNPGEMGRPPMGMGMEMVAMRL
jgi:hypothetical protein